MVIVPLPITHDQYEKAQRYVDHYQDTMIDQNSPTFVDELHQVILSATIQTKSYDINELDALIKGAKEMILYEMLDK